MIGRLLHRSSARTRWVLASFLLVATATVLAIGASAAAPPPTFGPIPDAAFVPGQPLDPSLVPDFVTVLDRAGNPAGYVRKEELLAADVSGATVKAVYGPDLKTIIGSMVPNKGFVPNGVKPASIPDFPASAGPTGAPAQ